MKKKEEPPISPADAAIAARAADGWDDGSIFPVTLPNSPPSIEQRSQHMIKAIPTLNERPSLQFGEFQRVCLNEKQYCDLLKKMTGAERDRLIEELDNYMESKGVKYKNHYATLVGWHRKRLEKDKPSTPSGTCARRAGTKRDFESAPDTWRPKMIGE
jgi:hypothetical protein